MASTAEEVLIWDRKTEGGFPETKILKQLIRNHIEPDKKLGHSDTPSSKAKTHVSTSLEDDVVVVTGAGSSEPAANATTMGKTSDKCEDCA